MSNAERNARGRLLGRILIEIWKRDRCTECGRHLPPHKLALHHRPGTDKRFNIGDWSQRPTRSLRTLAAELRKTVPLCHGCHADQHRDENRQRALTALRDRRGRFVAANSTRATTTHTPGGTRDRDRYDNPGNVGQACGSPPW